MGQGPSLLTVGAGWGLFGYFFSFIISFPFFLSLGDGPDIDCNTVSKGR